MTTKKPNLPKSLRWGGRFQGGMSPLMCEINASIEADKMMWQEEIDASTAHVEMLVKQKIISGKDGKSLLRGLSKIAKEMAEGTFPYKEAEEDIHMNVEARLYELEGDVAGRLHTGRSRNDQVSVCMRLYLIRRLGSVLDGLEGVRQALSLRAQEHKETVMPGFTHGQIAQPITMGLYLEAIASMFDRDKERLEQTRSRMNVSPLGACALRGTTFAIDPAMTSKALGFRHPIKSNLDAVSDRDFVLDTLYSLSLLGIHISRFCEDIFTWCGSLHRLVSLPDSLCTGSSMMPNKRNPDSVEMLRSYCSGTTGALTSALQTLKGLPMGYCKDLQALNPVVFTESLQMVKILALLQEVVEGLNVDKVRCLKASQLNESDATDLAEKKAIEEGDFLRKAHKDVGGFAKSLELKDKIVLWFKRATEQNDADAQFALGVMYYHGQGVPKDDKQAVFWYEKAVAQGFADAQFALGVMYEKGLGVRQDDKQAVFWYEKAVAQGNALAQFALGVMYEKGLGVRQDDKQAVFWYEKAVAQGNALAQFALGVMYEKGLGVRQDDKQAVFWYEKAVAQGDARAQFNLGVMYRKGQGVPKDIAKAKELWEKAAAQGYAGAQNNLGVMYAEGQGVSQDTAKAKELWEKAAAQGYALAQNNLKILKGG